MCDRWVQEEPQNMGMWEYVQPRFGRFSTPVRYLLPSPLNSVYTSRLTQNISHDVIGMTDHHLCLLSLSLSFSLFLFLSQPFNSVPTSFALWEGLLLLLPQWALVSCTHNRRRPFWTAASTYEDHPPTHTLTLIPKF